VPWEWRQANAFTEEERLRVAARHMLMAANAGHLTAHGCLRVMDNSSGSSQSPTPTGLT
jgi:hypothetical protein